MKDQEEAFIQQITQFDDHFPEGVFAVPKDENEPKIKVRLLHLYCKEKGVKPKDLTEEEMALFMVKTNEKHD